MSLGKLPPHVARELRRHVQRSKPSSAPTSTCDQQQKSKTLRGVLFFTGFAASIPFLAMQWIGPLNNKDDALTPAQVRRGPYINSGSKDVGKDPKWNFETGTYQLDPELFKKDRPEELDHGDQYRAAR